MEYATPRRGAMMSTTSEDALLISDTLLNSARRVDNYHVMRIDRSTLNAVILSILYKSTPLAAVLCTKYYQSYLLCISDSLFTV